ncbi:MAG TPA: GntR family transcriptional regulator [Bacillales bacterium]|nr:GntR family transcriptional regulator [Bacillales bacterium]
MVDKQSPLPIYFQLEEEIKNRIDQKELVPGDLIPSEREFAEQHGISRMTVRQAISDLVNEGYLYRQKGKGTFVARKKIEQPLHRVTSFTEDMIARGMKPSSRLVRFEVVSVSDQTAEELAVESSEPAYEIKRVRLADGLPMALETNIIPVRLAEGLTEEHAHGSLYDYVAGSLPSPIDYARQVIESSAAHESESEALGIPKGSPILLIRQNTYLADGTPFELVKSAYRADRYKFIIDMHRISD